MTGLPALERQQAALLDALLGVDRLLARRLMDEALSVGKPVDVVNRLMVPALERLGQLWERGDAALSQVYMSGRICEELVDELLPPRSPVRIDQPRMAIAVLNDFHMLGKRIVYSMLRSAGYEVEDLGRQTVEGLVEAVRLQEIKILLVSVLMLPSALDVKELKQGLVEAGLGHVRIVVGGAPFRLDPALGAEVGADAVGRDASDAVRILAGMVGVPGGTES